MLIDIDESVSLGVLACTCGHKVDRTPCRVADQVDAVFDSFFHGLDMLSEVGDPVLIVDGAILLDLIECAEAVLDDHERSFRVTVLKEIQCVAEAVRIDLPAPVGSFEVRVLCAAHHIALDLVNTFLDRYAVGHIVGEGVEVDSAFLNDREIFLVVHEGCIDAEFFEILSCEVRIFAADLYVAAEVVADLIASLELEHIFRIRCQRIPRDMADHVADHEVGVDLVAFNDRFGGCDELIMESFKS